MSETRVGICIPSGDLVHADFAVALAALANQCKGIYEESEFINSPRGPDGTHNQVQKEIPIALINVKDSLVQCGRNKLVEEATNLGVTHCLFLDSDIVPHPGTLRRLLEHDKDIVGATYLQRKPPYAVLGKAEGGEILQTWVQTNNVNSAELQNVDALPFGCVLVKTSVLQAVATNTHNLPFQTPKYFNEEAQKWMIEGEDYFFCRRAKELGFSIWLDWVASVHIRHVGIENFQISARKAEGEDLGIIH